MWLSSRDHSECGTVKWLCSLNKIEWMLSKMIKVESLNRALLNYQPMELLTIWSWADTTLLSRDSSLTSFPNSGKLARIETNLEGSHCKISSWSFRGSSSLRCTLISKLLRSKTFRGALSWRRLSTSSLSNSSSFPLSSLLRSFNLRTTVSHFKMRNFSKQYPSIKISNMLSRLGNWRMIWSLSKKNSLNLQSL